MKHTPCSIGIQPAKPGPTPTSREHRGRICRVSRSRGRGAWLAVALVLGGMLGTLAQEVLHVYTSEGPATALRDAASAFFTNNSVKVIGGSPPEWMARAVADADIVCSSADFMMADFLHSDGLQVDASTVTPLYMRPSAILVRPGNPKRVDDFPDLLQPGVRVMVVTGSGQTGLWEDMAGRTADVQAVRRLRENIVAYAPSSTEAVRMWRDRKDIDAWITWDIWHMPLRTEAKLIPVSKEYRVHRQCSVALTRRGREKPQAGRFVEFLASPQGARIFASWGWMTPGVEENALAVRHDITVACSLEREAAADGVLAGLGAVKRLIEGYESMGVARHEIHVSVIVMGPALPGLLKDAAYQKLKGSTATNPNKSLIEGLLGCGVSLEVGEMELKQGGWSKADVWDGIQIVAGAPQRLIDLQLRGYAYLGL